MGLLRTEGQHDPGHPLLTARPCAGRGGVGTHQEAELSIGQDEDGEGQARSTQLLGRLLKGLPKHRPLPDEAQLLGSLGAGEGMELHGPSTGAALRA